MADSTLVEGIKLIGGIAGLATGAFTLFDRVFRHRPVCSIYGLYDEDASIDPQMFIRVRNTAKHDIVVSGIAIDAAWLHVSPEESFRKARLWSFEAGVLALVGPEAERSFPLETPGRWSDGPDTDRVAIRVSWRRVGGVLRRGIPVRLRTTRGELRQIRADVVRLSGRDDREGS